MEKRTTFEDVVSFYNDNYSNFMEKMNGIENIINVLKDDASELIPIYTMKSRIKAPDSIYLKVKRFPDTNLNEFTDFIGIRALCLFQKDIFKVHDFFLSLLSGSKKKEFADRLVKVLEKSPEILDEIITNIDNILLKEIKIYNWDNEEDNIESESNSDLLSNAIVNILENQDISYVKNNWNDQKKSLDYNLEDKTRHIQFAIDSKPSGYKSIHYIAELNNIPIEIQLRTLLQDVWGELEHSLSYKEGFTHPHIKKSFKLLSRDLESTDQLMTHLRKIHDREGASEQFSISKSPLTAYFDYEDSFISSLFDNPDLKKAHKDYDDMIRSKKESDSIETEVWIENTKEKLQIIIKLLEKKDSIDAQYFRDMETAYLHSFEGKLLEALDIYLRQADRPELKDKYVLCFRTGEIYLKLGESVTALKHFDRCETILETLKHTADYLHQYRVKSQLAKIYWTLGPDYIDIAIEKIEEAKKIFEDHPEAFEHNKIRYYLSIINNICYYYLDKYIVVNESEGSNAGKYYLNAEKYYYELFKLIQENVSMSMSNEYDTAAWFCYNAALKHKVSSTIGDKAKKFLSFLELAKRNTEEAWLRSNRSTLELKSRNLQMAHIKDIMLLAEEIGIK